MTLPKIEHPTYKLSVPSTKKSITFRPFTVKEEKILLTAQASTEDDSIVHAIKQIIENCVYDNIDVNNLAMFDVEYIFINLRAKSVSDIIEAIHTDDDEGQVEYEINLNNIEVKKDSSHKTKFIIFDKVGVIMRYPTMDELFELQSEEEETDITDKAFKLLMKCITMIYDTDKVYEDFTPEELEEFILSMPSDAVNKLNNFFDTMPSVVYETTITLPSGKTKDIELRGLTSFFTF